MWPDVATLQQTVARCNSVAECIRALNIPYSAPNFKKFRAMCEQNGIDISFPNYIPHNYIPDSQVFVENSEYINNRINLKERILKNGWMEYRCVECGLEGEWNGKPLVLQLDHINGVNSDHRLENLRFLCPNCHTQTDTYAGKSRSRLKYKDIVSESVET